MTPRERVIKTLSHEQPDRAPRELWALPGVPRIFGDEYEDLVKRFPSDFTAPPVRYGASERAQGTPCEVGQYTDAWGCVWHVAEYGIIGEVKEPPLADWSKLADYKPPFELLDEADLSDVNQACAATDHFVKTGSTVRPFERLQFLRGTEATYMDLAYGTKGIFTVLQMLHDFYCRDLEMLAATDVDGVAFMDDWGSQDALLISPNAWREIFKPMYKDYCDILRAKGKYVFFHSDGHISAIYPDLIEVGVHAINSQLFCMDIEELGKNHAGEVTFWGEIDRQQILPFGTEEDVRQAVRRVHNATKHAHGGVIAQCEWGKNSRPQNVAAVFEEWDRLTQTD